MKKKREYIQPGIVSLPNGKTFASRGFETKTFKDRKKAQKWAGPGFT